MNFITSLRQRFLAQRFPKKAVHKLDHRSLFILPTRFGIFVLLTCVLLFILGTNYQNNPILVVCYFLLAFFLVSIFSCYFNLTAVNFSIERIEAIHEKDSLHVFLNVEGDKPRYGWHFYYAGNGVGYFPEIKAKDKLKLAIDEQQRGFYSLDKITLETRFPLGLIRCWTYLSFAQNYWIYPQSKQGDWRVLAKPLEGEDELPPKDAHQQRQADVFEGVKPFIQGESLSRISWKHYAKSPDEQLYSKAFSSSNTQECWLSLDTVNHVHREEQLRILTHACLSLDNCGDQYGLTLPHGSIAPASGPDHLKACLELLATCPEKVDC